MDFDKVCEDLWDKNKTVRFFNEELPNFVNYIIIDSMTVCIHVEHDWEKGSGYISTIFGRRLYALDDRSIVFGECEYCRTHEAPRYDDMKLFCSKCGAEVR